MAQRRSRTALNTRIALSLVGVLTATPAIAQSSTDHPPDLPLPSTTTQERLVNPFGLSEADRLGWHSDFLGTGRGIFDASVGVKFWPDRFDLRNFIFGGSVDLLPGVRARANFRRREGEEQAFEVQSDEIYLEGFQRYRGRNWQGGGSVRLGHVRYLHFPYPDAIAEFDQVPGYHDLRGGPETDYRSVVLVGEATLNSGFGVHGSARLAGLDDSNPAGRILDAYGFYRHDFAHTWHFESRLGALALRHEPLGRGGQFGGDVYLGKQVGEFNVGVLYENKNREHEYAGLMIQFRPGPVTRALGKVDFDYSRQPEGFTMQVPLLHLRLNESRTVRSGDELVGEVRAVRIRTLWQQGFVRNEYEHRLESWGRTGDPKLHCVVTEEPWYLEAEALVSPHLVPDARWERDREGPAQYVQRVTYRYYQAAKPKHSDGA